MRRGGALGLLGVSLLAGCSAGIHDKRGEALTTALVHPQVGARFGGPRNFVMDGSFESSVSHWAPIDPESQLAIVRGMARFGRRSLRVTARGGAAAGAFLANVVSAPPRGSAYQLSLWVRGDVIRSLVVELSAGGGRYPERSIARKTIRTSGTWNQVSMQGMVRRADRQYVTLYVLTPHSVSANDVFYVDGVNLQQIR
jgi:hypothetical protein